MLTKLGWVLLGGNNNKTEECLENISSDGDVEYLVERFWDIECYETVNKKDPEKKKKKKKRQNVLLTYLRKLQRRKRQILCWPLMERRHGNITK